MTAKYLPRLDEDTRLLPILSHLSLSYLSGASASDYTFSASDGENKVTAEMVDGLAKKHFPPCARHLWEEGKAKNHLKHYARLQFGLFLKVRQLPAPSPPLPPLFDQRRTLTLSSLFGGNEQGIGLSIDEALLYWRKLFAVGQKMSEDKFKKEHVYNIRHSFGLEGAKKNYTPKSYVFSLPPSSSDVLALIGFGLRLILPSLTPDFLPLKNQVPADPDAEPTRSARHTRLSVQAFRTRPTVPLPLDQLLPHRPRSGRGDGSGVKDALPRCLHEGV